MRYHSDQSRRQFLRTATGAVGGLVLLGTAACGGAAGTSTRGSRTFSAEVAATHLNNIVHQAPLFIAKDAYYGQEGLDLSYVGFPGGASTIRGMASGMPLGAPACLPTIIAYAKSQSDLRIVGTTFNSTAVYFVAPTNSPVRSVADMKGRTVAVSRPGSNSTYFAKRTLREAGFEPGRDVTVLSVGGPSDAWTAASQGVVDVAWSTLPLLTKLQNSGKARTVWRSSDFVSAWADSCLATSDGFLQDHADVVAGWVRAITKAMQMIRDDTERAARIYADAVGLNRQVAELALKAPPRGTWTTDIDKAAYEENVKAGLQLGQLSSEPNLDELLVDRFVQTGLGK